MQLFFDAQKIDNLSIKLFISSLLLVAVVFDPAPDHEVAQPHEAVVDGDRPSTLIAAVVRGQRRPLLAGFVAL